MNIAPFTEADLEETDAVLRLAYKTKFGRKDSLRRYLELESCGSFVAKMGETVVAFGGTIDYGKFAYIGLMATHPDSQRRGIGSSILEQILAWLKSRNCETVLLDASPAGAPLYEKNDFVDEDSTLVLQKRNSGKPRTKSEMISSLPQNELPILASTFDAPIFGAQRLSLLESYWKDDPSRFLVSRNLRGEINGYLVAQPRTLGPWLSQDIEISTRLLSRALELSFEEEPQVFVSASNSAALNLLEESGFSRLRGLRHMRRGKHVEREKARYKEIFGQATLGFG